MALEVGEEGGGARLVILAWQQLELQPTPGLNKVHYHYHYHLSRYLSLYRSYPHSVVETL